MNTKGSEYMVCIHAHVEGECFMLGGVIQEDQRPRRSKFKGDERKERGDQTQGELRSLGALYNKPDKSNTHSTLFILSFIICLVCIVYS